MVAAGLEPVIPPRASVVAGLGGLVIRPRVEWVELVGDGLDIVHWVIDLIVAWRCSSVRKICIGQGSNIQFSQNGNYAPPPLAFVFQPARADHASVLCCGSSG